jgi:hypothetical protein
MISCRPNTMAYNHNCPVRLHVSVFSRPSSGQHFSVEVTIDAH